MSVREASEKKANQTAPSENGSGISAGPAGNVDRIREILFGPQIREYGQRLARIEEHLSQETTELKSEVRRRLEALEGYARQEVKDWNERLRTERDERSASGDRLSQTLASSIKSLENRLTESDERTSTALRELRQLTFERIKSMVDDFTTQMDTVQSSQNRHLEELRGHSIDRFAFASLLTELALRVQGELAVPGLEEPDGNAKP
jgi:uncharacterized protein YicC (UPF0701 family)